MSYWTSNLPSFRATSVQPVEGVPKVFDLALTMKSLLSQP